MTWADEVIEAARNLREPYLAGRIESARIHAINPQLTPEQRAEWQRIADTLEAWTPK